MLGGATTAKAEEVAVWQGFRGSWQDGVSRSHEATAARTTLQLEAMVRRGDGFTAAAGGGATARLTIVPRLQATADEIFDHFRIPYGAAVVLSVRDGRVLALAGRSAAAPELGPEELALQAWAPAASVFKLVSASALVADAGIGATSRACYHDGVSAVRLDNLIDIPRIDRTCADLAYAIGKSQNAIVAKLAVAHLTPGQLEHMGHAFGFGETIPFDLPIEPSHLDVPDDDRLEFARAAAGFWHSTLSPIHGALLAATIANRGEMPAPYVVEEVVDADGHTAHARAAGRARVVMGPRVAREIGQMMELTTQMGTARAAFHDRRGHRLLPVEVAGKTGTLSARTDKGYLSYSWFVGYAPAESPQIAFAVVLANAIPWRIKAAYVARRLVEEYVRGEHPASDPSRMQLLTASRSPGGPGRASD